MRRHALAALLVSSDLVLTFPTVTAITDGELDGTRHPYVGLMVAQDADLKPLWRCSGTLISETVFLTAGHCTEAPAAHIEIWFAADVEHSIPANGYPYTGDVGGTPFTHPLYDPNIFYLHDLGVVQLDSAFPMTDYGAPPEQDVLDALQKARGENAPPFPAVGYGLQKSFPDAASWMESSLRIRMLSTPRLIQINTPFTGDHSLLLSNNAATGGICFGDSGGPNFIGNADVIGAVTSFALNRAWGGTGGVYRVDRADNLEWLATFGVTP